MLVLTRRQDDTVVIDGRIEIKVLKVQGKSIRLGITAPSDVKILRGEIQPFEIDGGEANGTRRPQIAENCSTYRIGAIEIAGEEIDLGVLKQSLVAQAS